ncbi:MAG: pirin family protein [Candidatus Sericytochromatia bacterium]
MSAIQDVFALGFPWQTRDPFLFCVYHQDFYPTGNAHLGPTVPLTGRNLGQDFVIKDGWRMYHGEQVPGFPGHPHRGFETVTAVLQGTVDHADSLGAAGRYGSGDVQWMTAGRGVQHAEMFPLLKPDGENTLELFQIWLNLPARSKMVDPYFGMLWNTQIPTWFSDPEDGPAVSVRMLAGELAGLRPPAPPPDSWAADPDHGVAIWTIEMEPGARWPLPAAAAGLNRSLYFYAGDSLQIEDQTIKPLTGVNLVSDKVVPLVNGDQPARLLMLQGRPIAEPVVQYGPFVMNSEAEIYAAFADYQRDQFGGWPWPSHEPVHGPSRGRFARYADGREETPDTME